MIGAGTALGVHCAFGERAGDYLALSKTDRYALLLASALLWPAAISCMIVLALATAADR